jgi:hypothetical protein
MRRKKTVKQYKDLKEQDLWKHVSDMISVYGQGEAHMCLAWANNPSCLRALVNGEAKGYFLKTLHQCHTTQK